MLLPLYKNVCFLMFIYRSRFRQVDDKQTYKQTYHLTVVRKAIILFRIRRTLTLITTKTVQPLSWANFNLP